MHKSYGKLVIKTMERAELTLRIDQNIEENSQHITHAIQRFESTSSTLFNKTGLLTVENTSNEIKIDVSKQGDKSKGIKSMQIYCFDMALMSLLKEKGVHIDFLIHDSHLFDAVDSRQVAYAPVTGRTLAKLIIRGDNTMKIRPYLTYQGTCSEALELYKKAFNTDILQIMRFSDMPPNPEHPVPEGFKNQIVQATMKFGDDFIRLSDCPGKLNAPKSERISLAIETSVEEVKYAFSILAEEGRIAIPLAETFYSPCAGVVFDKFGVMWNFVAQK